MPTFTDPAGSLAPRTGTLVERYLFSPLRSRESSGAVLSWWERRRLFYNIVVGTAGLLTLGTAFGLAALIPGPGWEGPPLTLIPVYALAANLFYSLGTPIHLLLCRWLKQEAGPVAQALFRYGLAFSVGLTLLPIPMLLVGGLLTVLLR
jgi:hypothetical protein